MDDRERYLVNVHTGAVILSPLIVAGGIIAVLVILRLIGVI